MVALDEHECPVEGCTEAYPHSLLTDAHVVDEHEDWLDKLIRGERDYMGA